MFEIYVRQFLAPEGRGDGRTPGTPVREEDLIYRIPSDEPGSEVLIDPKVKNEMGKAGSFEFAMEQDNPWYSSFEQLKTIMRVKYDNETIFYGRVLSIDTDMWGKRSVHCEGALAFLLDTMMEATKEDDRKKISLQQYVKDLIDTHNNMIADEPAKKFEYGQIPGYYAPEIPDAMKPETPENRKFGTGSWTSIMNCLEDLTSKYGGYWRARYNDHDDKLYLDWFTNFFDPEVCNQPLEVTDNIISMTNTVDVNGIFTVLIPEGTKNGSSLYLDDVPKTVQKTKKTVTPTKKETVGPGLGNWVDGQGMAFD